MTCKLGELGLVIFNKVSNRRLDRLDFLPKEGAVIPVLCVMFESFRKVSITIVVVGLADALLPGRSCNIARLNHLVTASIAFGTASER